MVRILTGFKKNKQINPKFVNLVRQNNLGEKKVSLEDSISGFNIYH